jgi:hypothetical protein
MKLLLKGGPQEEEDTIGAILGIDVMIFIRDIHH